MKLMLLTVHVELLLAYTCDFGKKHELEVFDREIEGTGNCRTAFQVVSHVISSQKVFNFCTQLTTYSVLYSSSLPCMNIFGSS